MTLFPFFENIDNRTFLIVGGGHIAQEKLGKLQLFTNRIMIVAENTDMVTETADLDGVTVYRKTFDETDLALGDYVIAATDNRELNAEIAALCTAQGKPVNVVDDPERCTFVFPALIRRGGLTIAVSTDGKSPAFAGYLRREIEKILPDHTEMILDTLYNTRQELQKTVPDQAQRAEMLREKLYELLEEMP